MLSVVTFLVLLTAITCIPVPGKADANVSIWLSVSIESVTTDIADIVTNDSLASPYSQCGIYANSDRNHFTVLYSRNSDTVVKIYFDANGVHTENNGEFVSIIPWGGYSAFSQNVVFSHTDARLFHAWHGYRVFDSSSERIWIKNNEQQQRIITDGTLSCTNPKYVLAEHRIYLTTGAFLIEYQCEYDSTRGWCLKVVTFLNSMGWAEGQEVCRTNILSAAEFTNTAADIIYNTDYAYLDMKSRTVTHDTAVYVLAYAYYNAVVDELQILVTVLSMNILMNIDTQMDTEIVIARYISSSTLNYTNLLIHGIQSIHFFDVREDTQLFITAYSIKRSNGSHTVDETLLNPHTVSVCIQLSRANITMVVDDMIDELRFDIHNAFEIDERAIRFIPIPAEDIDNITLGSAADVNTDIFAVIYPNLTEEGYALFVKFVAVFMSNPDGFVWLEWISDVWRISDLSVDDPPINVCAAPWYPSMTDYKDTFLVSYVVNSMVENGCDFKSHLWKYTIDVNIGTHSPTTVTTQSPTTFPTHAPFGIEPSWSPMLFPTPTQTPSASSNAPSTAAIIVTNSPSFYPTVYSSNMENATEAPDTVDASVPPNEEEISSNEIAKSIFSDVTFLVIIVVVIVLGAITIIAYVHVYVDLPCFWATDDARAGSLIAFALQVLDFLSDVNFSYKLSLIPNPSRFVLNLFYISLVFVFLPWLLNVGWLLIQRRKWGIRHSFVNIWIRDYAWFLMSLTMISGGANSSIKLCTSRLLGLKIFSMALPKHEYIQLSKWPILLSVIFENIPQIVVQWFFITAHKDVDVSNVAASSAAYFSLVSSSTAVLFAVLVLILRCSDPFNDSQFVINLTLNVEDANDRKIRNRLGKRKKIARYVARAINADDNAVTIHSISQGFNNLNVHVSIVQQQQALPASASSPSSTTGSTPGSISSSSSMTIVDNALLHTLNASKDNGKLAEMFKQVLRLSALPVVDGILPLHEVQQSQSAMRNDTEMFKVASLTTDANTSDFQNLNSYGVNESGDDEEVVIGVGMADAHVGNTVNAQDGNNDETPETPGDLITNGKMTVNPNLVDNYDYNHDARHGNGNANNINNNLNLNMSMNMNMGMHMHIHVSNADDANIGEKTTAAVMIVAGADASVDDGDAEADVSGHAHCTTPGNDENRPSILGITLPKAKSISISIKDESSSDGDFGDGIDVNTAGDIQ